MCIRDRLVEHRVVVREVVTSTPAGHSGYWNNWVEKCCLCNYISKWLDFQVFSDKDNKPEVPSHNPCHKNNCGTLKNPHTVRLLVRSRAQSSRCCGLAFTGPQYLAHAVVASLPEGLAKLNKQNEIVDRGRLQQLTNEKLTKFVSASLLSLFQLVSSCLYDTTIIIKRNFRFFATGDGGNTPLCTTP